LEQDGKEEEDWSDAGDCSDFLRKIEKSDFFRKITPKVQSIFWFFLQSFAGVNRTRQQKTTIDPVFPPAPSIRSEDSIG